LNKVSKIDKALLH